MRIRCDSDSSHEAALSPVGTRIHPRFMCYNPPVGRVESDESIKSTNSRYSFSQYRYVCTCFRNANSRGSNREELDEEIVDRMPFRGDNSQLRITVGGLLTAHIQTLMVLMTALSRSLQVKNLSPLQRLLAQMAERPLQSSSIMHGTQVKRKSMS